MEIAKLKQEPQIIWETLNQEFKKKGNLSRYRYLKERSSSESQKRKPKSPNRRNPGFLSRSELATRLGLTVDLLDKYNDSAYKFAVWTQFLDPEGREWFCQGDLCRCSEPGVKDHNGDFIYKDR